jgi:hypothetical protein
MITSVKITALRGVRDGGVDGLSPLSILVGPNNAGKSTVLEAIAVACTAVDASAVTRIMLRRGGPVEDALQRVVAKKCDEARIAITSDKGEWQAAFALVPVRDVRLVEQAMREGLTEPMVQLRTTLTGPGQPMSSSLTLADRTGRIATPAVAGNRTQPFDLAFVDLQGPHLADDLESAYTAIDRAGMLGTVLHALRRSLPKLTDLRILRVDSNTEYVLHAFFDGAPPVPAYLAGDGFKRFLELAAAALGLEGGSVSLIEEPEAFQHPRYMEEIATLLLLAAKSGKQVIVSTHSIELIDLLLHSREAVGLDYPTVHRVRLSEGKLAAVSLNHSQAIAARDELLEDLRA